MRTVNVVNVSGGKDSTAVVLLALERQTEGLRFVFADTGHEHPVTYDYLDYLERELGITVERVKADFAARIARKRAFVEANWPEEKRAKALEVLHPTGNPFLDLCIWKGLFPSGSQRFCTEFLKVEPITAVQQAALTECDRLNTWLGVRADESAARAAAVEWEREFGPTDDAERGLWKYRPILHWSAADVFDYIKRRGLKPNPLYTQGMSRVGCMPCMMTRKSELAEIAARFPDQIERVAQWEARVALASKAGDSTLFAAKRLFDDLTNITPEEHGIRQAALWARTSRGGRQYAFEFEEKGGCSSAYGLCEQGDE